MWKSICRRSPSTMVVSRINCWRPPNHPSPQHAWAGGLAAAECIKDCLPIIGECREEKFQYILQWGKERILWLIFWKNAKIYSTSSHFDPLLSATHEWGKRVANSKLCYLPHSWSHCCRMANACSCSSDHMKHPVFIEPIFHPGCYQQAGVDYGETFSHVIKPTTIRTVLGSVTLKRGR